MYSHSRGVCCSYNLFNEIAGMSFVCIYIILQLCTIKILIYFLCQDLIPKHTWLKNVPKKAHQDLGIFQLRLETWLVQSKQLSFHPFPSLIDKSWHKAHCNSFNLVSWLSDLSFFMCAFTPLMCLCKMSMMDCTVLFMHVMSCWAKAD